VRNDGLPRQSGEREASALSITWELQEQDRETFARELDAFVPDKVIDIHAHLYQAHWWADEPPHVTAGPAEVGAKAYREHMEWILPGRDLEALYFAYPFPTESGEDTFAANSWVAAQVAGEPNGRAQFLVRPTDDPDWVREQAAALGFSGLKPFSFYAPGERTWDAEIPDYLPASLMEAANADGWTITLHLVRSRGIADASNQHWIRRYCEAYPNAQIILDHCARGFNPHHVLEGLPALSGLSNLWVDTSSVCNSLAVSAVLDIIGPERMLYGSDFYVSHMRGTNFGVGDTFLWLDEDNAPPAPVYAPDFRLPLVGIENLRAVKAAVQLARLTDSQIEDYFRGNAARLLAR